MMPNQPINPDTKQRRSFVAQLHVASYPRRSYNYLHLNVRFQLPPQLVNATHALNLSAGV